MDRPHGLGYCDYCFANYNSLVYSDMWTRAQLKQVQDGRTLMGWARLFMIGGDLRLLWTSYGLPCLLHLPENMYLTAYGNSLSCGAFGKEAQIACVLRYLRLSPMLESTCLRFWGELRIISRESYHETIEIILMFLRGNHAHVPRPLPAIEALKRHAYICQ